MIHFVGDIPLYYEQYGEGKPVLCIHGYAADHRLMTGCVEPVFAELGGYRRIYPDLPGMGKTPAAPQVQNADDMLAVLEEFIDAAIPDEDFLVIGESYGGYLTLGLIRRIGERIGGAMLLCPVVIAERSKRRLPEKHIVWRAENLAETDATNAFLDMAVVATPGIYEKFKSDILPGLEIADREFGMRYQREGYGFSFEEKLKSMEFNRPMSILTGRQDHDVGYLDALTLLDRFPRATFALLDCAGHNLQIENEPLFRQHVRDWLWRSGLTVDA